MTTQWNLGFSVGGSTAAATFSPVIGVPNNGGSFVTAENRAQIPWAAAGNFRQAKIFLATAPGVGKSWRFQLSVGGTPSTAIDITISDNATSGNVTANVAISAGDLVAWKITPSGTPTANAVFELWLEWDPTTTDEFVYGGIFGNADVSLAARFNPLLQGFYDTQTNLGTETVANGASQAPIAGQITAFYVALSAAPTVGNSWDFSVRNNVTDIGSLLNISGAATAGNQTGLSHSVSVLDRLGFHIVNRNGTPTNTRVAWSVIFKPTTAGYWCLTGSGKTNWGSASSPFFWMPGGGGVGAEAENTVEAAVQLHGPTALTAIALCYRVTTTPGAGNAWLVSSRLSGFDGNLTINAGNVTSGSDTAHSDVIVVDQLFNIGVVESSGPASMGAHSWGLGLSPIIELATIDTDLIKVAANINVDEQLPPLLSIGTSLAKAQANLNTSQSQEQTIATALVKVRASIGAITDTEPNEVWIETWEEQDP